MSAGVRRAPGALPATVTVLREPRSRGVSPHGPVRSVQEALVELPRRTLEEIWRPEHLERLARSYWRYLSRISLGLLRVVYEPSARTIVLGSGRLPLLRFRAPQYVATRYLGQVTWPIERGVLVARAGRARGYLRIAVRREPGPDAGGDEGGSGGPGAARRTAVLRVRAEVANFYPLLRGGGPFARLGAHLYNATQLRVHVLVMRGFLRSLARLDLPPPAGAEAPPAAQRDSI